MVGLEVSGFHIHLHAIAQGNLRHTELAVWFLRHNLAWSWESSHQGGRHCLLLVSVVLFLLGSKYGAFDFRFRRDDKAFLVRTIHHEHLVLVGDDVAHLLVHLVEVHLAIKLLHQLEVIGRSQDRLGIQKVVHTLAHIVRVLVVILHLHLSLGGIEIETFGTLQLALGETVLAGTFHLAHSHRDTPQDIVLLTTDAQAEGILGAGHEELAILHRRTHERRISHLLFLSQAAVEHIGYQTADVILTLILHGVLQAIGSCLALHIEMTEDDRLLLVLLDGDDHLVVVGHWIVDTLGRILVSLDLAEEFLYLLLHLIHVEVAHHHDGLQVGAIPLLVVVTEVLVREVIHDVHIADRQTVLVLAALVNLRHHVLHHALHRHARAAVAPLLVDDTTLLVYLLRFEVDVLAPVVEHEETGVDDALPLDRHGSHVIHRLVNGGIGIEVGAELYADGLAPRHDAEFLALAREVLGAVERHVLQEVSQATLARFLQDRAHTLCDIEVCKSSLLSIMTDIIGKSVLQLALTDGRILIHILCEGGERDGREEEET